MKEGLRYEFSVKLHMNHSQLILLLEIYLTLLYWVCAKMTVSSFNETAWWHSRVFIYIINGNTINLKKIVQAYMCGH